MARKIATGIDIGTSQIKVVVAENIKLEDGTKTPRIIGTGIAESKGLRHGYIVNINDVAKSIKLAVAQAEKMAKVKIKNVYMSIGGVGLGTILGKGSVMTSKADSEITDLDVKNILALAESDIPQSSLLNKKIIHPIPLAYKIDGQLLMGRPVGMYGNKLETKVLFVTCLEQHLNDLIKALEEADLELADAMVSPFAASLVNLSKTQKIAGCVLVNIGAETVSFVVFENNIPISLEVIPLGSTNITNDIALNFRIPIEEAEGVKIGSLTDAQYSKKKLDDIIMTRLSEIFEFVENHLKKIGRSELLPAGIILTGGGSGIATIEEIARATLKLPAKIATINPPHNIKNSPLKDTSWSVAYGLAIWGLNNGEDITTIGSGAEKKGVSIFNRLQNWLKRILP